MSIRGLSTRRTGAVATLLLVCSALATGCGPRITLPDVVGMRLDAAHRKFEALGVKSFDDRDVIGEEDAIVRDANWVVVKQDPAPATGRIDTDTTIRLSVGHEDEREVLALIPSNSPFAREMAREQQKRQAAGRADGAQKPGDARSTKPKSPATEDQQTVKDSDVAAECAKRKGNFGEIYVWNSYGSDQPPEAMRLGGGYVWDFGDKQCITSTEFALSTVPSLDGFCTEVGKVSANPGYPVDARPAPRIPNIIGHAGDC